MGLILVPLLVCLAGTAGALGAAVLASFVKLMWPDSRAAVILTGFLGFTVGAILSATVVLSGMSGNAATGFSIYGVEITLFFVVLESCITGLFIYVVLTGLR